jgi:hypothetical protein
MNILGLFVVSMSLVSAWVAPAFLRNGGARSSSLNVASRDDLEYLPLSSSDLSRLTLMRERHTTLPIVISEAMLPGQVLEMGSADPKFIQLLQQVLSSKTGEFGMIGINPHTGRPLNIGVTVALTENKINLDDNGVWSISVKAKKPFEVQGEPWMDETSSFYIADVELVDSREEPELDDDVLEEAQAMSDAIPELVEEWLKLVLSTEASDVEGMSKIMKDIGSMPKEIGSRAVWVASLVNPCPALGVCLEVRPAMLACKNDFDRIMLATAAIQGSMDHMSGKRKLF